MKPKVSIIMPVLNGERYISEAIESILAQTHGNYELVVVDDGSTDRTRELVHAFQDKLQIRYINHPVRKGIAVSVNDGLRNSSGEYVNFLDHDDAWLPNLLSEQVSYLDQHADVGMVYSDFQTIDSEGRVIEESVAYCRERKRPSGHVFRQLFMDSFIAANSVLIRKECFDRLGGFDETLHWGDYHMWLRIARHYKIDYIPKVLSKYRQHATQSTRSGATEHPDEDSVAMIAIRRILELYPELRQELGERTIRRRMAMLYYDMAYTWLWKQAHANARACLRRAIRLWPTNSGYYTTYTITLLPPAQAMAIRRGWRRLRRLFMFSAYRSEQFEARN